MSACDLHRLFDDRRLLDRLEAAKREQERRERRALLDELAATPPRVLIRRVLHS